MRLHVVLPRHLTNETGVTQEMDLSDGSTILDAVRSLGVRPDEVLAIMGGRPVPIDRVLHDGDHVELIAIASGG